MKMTKKVVGALLAAAVLLIGSVSAFAAPSPTAKGVLTVHLSTEKGGVEGVEITDADVTSAPTGAVGLVCYYTSDKPDAEDEVFAKAAGDGTIVEVTNITINWVDENGNILGEFKGDCTVTINYDAQEGDVILHKTDAATVEELKTTVVAGESASAKVSSRSPFAILRKATATNGSAANNSSSSAQVLGAQVNMMTYVIIIAGLVACAAVLGSVVVLRKRQ